MKRVMYRAMGVVAIVLIWQQAAWCQQEPFIHIQSENDQAFAVHINGNTIQSSDGYLVVPKLVAGSYTIVMSFPGTSLPEYAFSCAVEDKSLAYSLRLGIDNKWSLFNMVDFAVMTGTAATREQVLAATQKPGEEKPVAIENTPPVSTPPKAIPSSIRKIFDRATPGGKDQVYIVTNGSKTDTVAIFIPDLEAVKPGQTGKLIENETPSQEKSFTMKNIAWSVPVRRNKLLQ